MKHFQPRVTSPTASLLGNSRVSERSTEGDRSFKVNHSFDFDTTFIDSPANKFSASAITPALPAPRTRTPTQTADQIKRNYLAKVLIHRTLAARAAVKKMQSLPIKIFKKGPAFALAKEIVMRAKLNIETSILRTLIFAEEEKTRQQSRLQCRGGNDVFVLPSPVQQEEGRPRKALLELAELLKAQTRKAVRAFKTYCEQQKTLARYFGKVCANFHTKRQDSFIKISHLPPTGVSTKAKGQLVHTQLKLAGRIVQGKYRDLLQYSLATLKRRSKQVGLRQQSAARQIITFARIRREQCLKQWAMIAKSTKLKQERESAVNAEKIEALKRIVQRNYIKLFLEIARRVKTFSMAAYRIGCCSKINEQKSLWRLLTHMRQRVRQDRLKQQQQ